MQKLLSEKVDKHSRGQDHNSKLPSVDNVMKNLHENVEEKCSVSEVGQNSQLHTHRKAN